LAISLFVDEISAVLLMLVVPVALFTDPAIATAAGANVGTILLTTVEAILGAKVVNIPSMEGDAGDGDSSTMGMSLVVTVEEVLSVSSFAATVLLLVLLSLVFVLTLSDVVVFVFVELLSLPMTPSVSPFCIRR